MWLACCRIPSRRGALKHLSFRLLPAFFWTTPEFFLSLTGAVSSCNQGSPGAGVGGGQSECAPGSLYTGLPLAGGTGQGPGGHLEPPLPSMAARWGQRLCTSGPGFPVTEGPPPCSELGFRCGPMGPHRCAGEVIGYPQPRPARAQEGKKGVTSAYSEVVVAPQKSQNGSRPLAVRPPCPWEPGG